MSNLVAKNITKLLGNPSQEILKNISLEIPAKQFVALTGKSGSGKSTLLYILSTLDNPTSGQLIIKEKNTASFDSNTLHQFRNEQVGFVFQFHYLLPELTALENVLMPARKMGIHVEKTKQAIELLEMFELSDKKNNLPKQMSGGQNQRVAIARALIMNPKFIFADEPTGNLDSTNSEKVFEILNQVNRDLGTTIVMVTHDVEMAAQTHRIIELKDGEVISDKLQREASKLGIEKNNRNSDK